MGVPEAALGQLNNYILYILCKTTVQLEGVALWRMTRQNIRGSPFEL
jgi:hypothetical protein